MEPKTRSAKIAVDRLRGDTYSEIASKHGISPTRARQICHQQARDYAKKDHMIAVFEARLDTAPGLAPERIDRIFSDFAKRIKTEMAAAQDSVPNSLGKQTPIDSLGFSCRTANGLRSLGAVTVSDAEKITNHQLMELMNFGKRSLLEFRSVFAEP